MNKNRRLVLYNDQGKMQNTPSEKKILTLMNKSK